MRYKPAATSSKIMGMGVGWDLEMSIRALCQRGSMNFIPPAPRSTGSIMTEPISLFVFVLD